MLGTSSSSIGSLSLGSGSGGVKVMGSETSGISSAPTFETGFENDFEKRFDFAKKIGDVNEKIIFNKDSEKIAELTIEEVRDKWTKPLWDRLA